MKALKWSLTEAREGRRKLHPRYPAGIVAPLCVTAFIYLFHLYPEIPDISIIYLLAVLGLASTRGRYSAILASLIAFFSFDFFLVPPLYMFTIGKLEEWVALFIFLLTAVTTGQLASALRHRAEQASQRESETRALYELLSATAREESLELQLAIVARAIVKNFAFAGIRNCTILLPGEDGKMSLHADAYPTAASRQLMPDEEQTALAVMHEGKIVDLYTSSSLFRKATGRALVQACDVGKTSRASLCTYVSFTDGAEGCWGDEVADGR